MHEPVPKFVYLPQTLHESDYVAHCMFQFRRKSSSKLYVRTERLGNADFVRQFTQDKSALSRNL